MVTYKLSADIHKFKATATQYYGENALVLADCANLAYESESEIKNLLLNEWGLSKFEFFNGISTQAFLVANEDIIIAAFRGTETTQVRDFLSDVKLIQTETDIPGLPGKVHRGFKAALYEIWAPMLTTLKRMRTQNQTVWFAA